MNNYFKLISKLKPYRLRLCCSILLAICFAVTNIFFLPLVRDIFNEIANKNTALVHNYILDAMGLYILFLITKYGQMYIMSGIGIRIIIDLRTELYEKLQELSLDFYQKWKMGDIIARVFTDVDKIKEALILNFQELIPQTLTFIGVLGYLFFINWKLSLFSLIGFPIFTYMVSYFGQKIKRISRQIQQKNADITQLVQEAVTNVQVIKSYTAERYEVDQFRKENQRSFTANFKAIRTTLTLEPLVSFLQFMIFGLIVWYGSYEVASGAFSGPKLGAFFMGLFLLIEPISTLSRTITITRQSFASSERVFELLSLEPTIKNPAQPKILSKVKGNISFQDVSFMYNGEHPLVLKNLNLDIQEGEIIAIVGMSGSGKTTLVNLIPRFFDPTEGKILLDGVDIKELDLANLRMNIGVVSQEAIMFRGTIAENIRYGKLTATNDEIVAAAKKANAWEFIEKKPDQLLTKIGDRGQKLSGGQKQRLSIARAILKDPKILILDEATSALDSKSEKLVQQALEVLMQGRTTFVIAHRLSTIMHAHKIIVLENGIIKEIGTHQELLKSGGIYDKLYKIQFRKN